ncbi:MAG: prepilin-type N-terminal cleavage/methylation domain-containing protein [Candidatus Hydrogenedentes bacterium]|nr:prepilin-type N-terminal cleavage/methylation domain-containing protein [Candidatus Hydrogenedentota bacterium]
MRRQPRHNSRRGFTLIELLVAVTLLSIVMAAVYSAFSSTILLWKRGDTNVETYQDARTSMGLLVRELQNVVSGSEYLFSGTKDSLTFFAAIPPMEVDDGEYTRLAQVTYRLKQDTKQRAWTLVREEALVEGILPLASKTTGKVDTDALRLGNEHTFDLASKVRGFALTYLWLQPVKADALAPGALKPPPVLVEREENPLGAGLPQGIRVTLTYSDDTAPEGQTSFSELVAFSTTTTALDTNGKPVLEGAK